jgi:hypothetical protein
VSATTTSPRDWSAIDSNKDNYVSPEEMQKYLDQAWAQRQESAQSASNND